MREELKERLIRHTTFLEEEIKDYRLFRSLRNIMAHEYLDIRWASIERFIRETEPLYKALLESVKEYLKRNFVKPGRTE
jgi:uncharacterized protein YutE (UPF0331/DUF86 family)